MRSWRPKPLRTSRAVVQLHYVYIWRTIHIKKHYAKPVDGAEKIAPQDLIQNILSGKGRNENIAVYEERHQRFLEILQRSAKRETARKLQNRGDDRVERKTTGASNPAGKFLETLQRSVKRGTARNLQERGDDRVGRKTAGASNTAEKSALKNDATEQARNDDLQSRRRRSFVAQAAALSSPTKAPSISPEAPWAQWKPDSQSSQQPTTESTIKYSNHRKIATSTFFDFKAAKEAGHLTSKHLKLQEPTLSSLSKATSISPKAPWAQRTSDSQSSQQPTAENTFTFFRFKAAKEASDLVSKHLDLQEPTPSRQSHNAREPLGHDETPSSRREGDAPSNISNQQPEPIYRQAPSEFESVIPRQHSNDATTKQKRSQEVKKPRLTLFEELFPEEAKDQAQAQAEPSKKDLDLPKLSLPVFDEDDAFNDEYVRGQKSYGKKASEHANNYWRTWNPSILVLQSASPSLTDADFRRIAPKGQHISEWTGPGDYFKVIPGRDAQTLAPETHYFLVFPNPAYAETYKKHVQNLHNLSRTYTPTSIESPITPPKGMLRQGQDVHSLLQEFTLVPPSQPLHLALIAPPLSPSLRRIMQNKGFPEITLPTDKTARSVLFWVEGFIPTIELIQQFITRDGYYRGMAWALMDGKDSIQQLEYDRKTGSESPPAEVSEEEEDDLGAQEPGARGQELREYVKRTKRRWTIAFEDENEARRFVRRWHLRPFSSAFPVRRHTGDHRPLVHAEFLW